MVGRITDGDGVPINGVIVDLFNVSDGSYQNSGVTDALGYYAAPSNYDAYFVATAAGSGYIDQVYAGISCPDGPAYYGLCALTSATPVLLNATSIQPHVVNFVLQSNDPIFADGFDAP